MKVKLPISLLLSSGFIVVTSFINSEQERDDRKEKSTAKISDNSGPSRDEEGGRKMKSQI
jgi:hypothetical protein